jgi:hypothetical protein
MPVPPRGVTRCAASPMRKIRPDSEPVRELGGEREGADTVDPDRQIGHTGADADQSGQPVGREFRRILQLRIELVPVPPSVAAAGRDERALADAVDAVPVRTEHLPQRRGEQGGRAGREPIGPAHRDAGGPPHRAAGTVGADDVSGVHDPGRAGRGVAQDGPYGVRAVGKVDQLRAQQHLGTGQRPQVVEQHRF